MRCFLAFFLQCLFFRWVANRQGYFGVLLCSRCLYRAFDEGCDYRDVGSQACEEDGGEETFSDVSSHIGVGWVGWVVPYVCCRSNGIELRNR